MIRTKLSPQRNYLTVKEASVLLKRPTRTVRHWCQTGYLEEAVRAGRDWLIPRLSIDTLIACGGHVDQRKQPQKPKRFRRGDEDA